MLNVWFHITSLPGITLDKHKSPPVLKQKKVVALLNLLVPLKEETAVPSSSRMRGKHTHTRTHLHDQQRTVILHHVLWTYIYGNFVQRKTEILISFHNVVKWQKDKKQTNKKKSKKKNTFCQKGPCRVMSTYQTGDFQVLQLSCLYQFSSNKFHLIVQTFLCDTNITKRILANNMENKQCFAKNSQH